MTRLELIQKIETRKKQINITIENLAKLSNLGVRTINRFFNLYSIFFVFTYIVCNNSSLYF